MIALLMAVLGVPAGFVLDRLIVELAVPWDDEDEEDEAAQPEPPKRRHRAGAETGSLAIPAEASSSEWARRLLVVGATAALFAATGARFSEPAHIAIVAAYLCVLIVCTATDLLVYRVPNAVTYPAMLGALLVAAAMPDTSLVAAIAGGLLGGGALFVPALFTGGLGMGMGDVKLAAFVGVALGFLFTVPALLVMAFTGGAVACFVLITGLRKKGEPIPYAPYVALGGVMTMLWQGTAFVSLR